MKKINLNLKANTVHPELWRKGGIFGRTLSIWVYRFTRVYMPCKIYEFKYTKSTHQAQSMKMEYNNVMFKNVM